MEPSLKSAVANVRRETGLPVAFAGTVESGAATYAITSTAGCISSVLDGLVIRSGNGLGGRVLADARIQTVADYLRDEGITHQYDGPVAQERLHSIVGAPVVIGGVVRAVLYGAMRTDSDIGSAALDAMRRSASGLAFELAVSDATAQRLRTMETAAVMREARATPTRPEWEEVRIAHAELRALAGSIGDEGLRHRLDDIASRLVTTAPSGDRMVLTERETDVLALVAIGCTNAEIAVRLEVGAETVKSYLRAAMRKLGAHRRTEAVTLARAAGVLP